MWLYQTLIRLLSPLIVLLLLLDARKRTTSKASFWHYIKQRLGWGYPPFHSDKPPIWIHCASVGEFKAAEPLIAFLQAKQHPILLTTNTPTAAQIITQTFPNLPWCYLPFDWPSAIQRFLDSFEQKPKALWVLETEIWPNLYRLVQEQGSPILILNGRLSQKTLKAPNWLQQSYHQSLGRVAQVLVRDQAEASRFETLGIPKAKIQVLGNLKFANLQTAQKSAEKVQNPQPCPPYLPKNRDFVLLASSHEDEEKQIARRWLKLNRPELLVVVPRHPPRGSKVAQQLTPLLESAQQLALYSQQKTGNENSKVFIVDTMGELGKLFACAKLVIMGGSFVPKGGHNILEPAAEAKPILTGPYMSDFKSETALLKQAEGIIQVSDYETLMTELQSCLQNPTHAETLGKNALKVIEQAQQQTLEAYLKALEKY